MNVKVVTCTLDNWTLHFVYQDLCLEQAISLDTTRTADDNCCNLLACYRQLNSSHSQQLLLGRVKVSCGRD